MRSIVILENKPEDFEVFLKCLPDVVKSDFAFHLVTDTRNYHVMNEIGELARKAQLTFYQYDGALLIRSIMSQHGFGNWFYQYHKSCKMILPIIFKHLGRFLYMDDDCLILNDPDPLWEYDFCSGRETVFARINSEARWRAYMEVIRNPRITQEYYNKNQLNSGTFMYKCIETVRYIGMLTSFTLHPFFKKEFENGRFILDEEFLSFWFIERQNQFVPSKYITIRNGVFSFKQTIQGTPLIYHYAVKDEYTTDYRDYFGNCYALPGMVISKFEDKLMFDIRKKSIVPDFKKEMRGRFKNVR